MLELIAQGDSLDFRWRRQLPEFPIELGRATEAYRVPWDPQISRRHVQLTPAEHHLTVTRLPSAGNPVFFNGQQSDQFNVRPGEHFVIGSTTFLVTADQAFGSLAVPNPISQKTFSSDFLKRVTYRDADRRIEVLNRIPTVIANADNPQELLIAMVNLLMEGIINATTIGIVQSRSVSNDTVANSPVAASTGNPIAAPTVSFLDTVGADSSQDGADEGFIRVIHWDRRGFERGDFHPSTKLVTQAVESEQTVLNVWHADSAGESEGFTFDYENDWAFACPLDGPATPNWAIYVAGSNRVQPDAGRSLAVPPSRESSDGDPELDLDGDLKFCELVASTVKNLMHVNRLERQQASLRSFFSPVVVDALRTHDPDRVLAPRKCDVSVLFCDLRGFARASEQLSHDLIDLLERVSESLSVMTGAVLDAGGVIGDFHGDAVMGFWGWPLEPDSPAQLASGAVDAARRIQTVFADQLCNHPRLQDFQVGLGIASGNAVAGKIGSRDQVKVTVFGPVVNLASRLEGMTRWLNSMVLADARTVQWLQALPESERPMHRRMGRFLPFGLETPVDVFQILDSSQVQANDVSQYHEALEHFEAGHWDASQRCLQAMRSEDSARQFLEARLKEQAESPGDFDGVIRVPSKR